MSHLESTAHWIDKCHELELENTKLKAQLDNLNKKYLAALQSIANDSRLHKGEK